MDLKLCTLVNHDQVNNTANFQYNQSHIKRDMALQSCQRIATYSKFVEIFKFLRFRLTSNFDPRYNFSDINF